MIKLVECFNDIYVEVTGENGHQFNHNTSFPLLQLGLFIFIQLLNAAVTKQLYIFF